MLCQVLTINTIKNDTHWLPEGFATSGYVFADFSNSSAASNSADAAAAAGDAVVSDSSSASFDNDFFMVSKADADGDASDAAASLSDTIIASACERDFLYADALGSGFRAILLAGKSAVECAVATCVPLPLGVHEEAEALRCGQSGDCVRMSMGMEEGPGRRRMRLKLVTGCGDYSNAIEARTTVNEAVNASATSTSNATTDAEAIEAVSLNGNAANDSFASLLPAGFSPSKKRPSLSS